MFPGRIGLLGLPLLVGLSLGCASTKPVAVFEPGPDDAVTTYYAAGTPYARLTGDCSELVCSMTQVDVGPYPYAAFFIRIVNTTPDPWLLEPLKAFEMQTVSKGEGSGFHAPASPTKILARITNAKNRAIFATAFAGAVEAAFVRPTTVSGPGGRYVIDDTDSKAGVIADRTSVAVATTALAGEALHSSVDSIVLRRNTLFPHQSVCGVVYFPVREYDPQTAFYRQMKDPPPVSIPSYVLRVHMPCGTRDVTFTPVAGE